jgi:hypothetical protein
MGYRIGYDLGYGQPAKAVARSLAMARKHPRPDADVARLAADLAGSWNEADGIEPWLRTHVPRFTRMLQDDGWSWADIARALMLAGIRYRSGRPWTSTLLAVKAAQVRAHRKKRARSRAVAELAEDVSALKERLRGAGAPTAALPRPVETRPTTRGASASSPPWPQPGPALAGPAPAPELSAAVDEGGSEPTEPEFAPAKPIGWTPSAQPAPAERKPFPPPPSVDVQEVLERFLNKPKR